MKTAFRPTFHPIFRTLPSLTCLPTALGLALSLVLAAGLGGCSGHGQHTTKQISTAKEKVNVIKSATEWQMAHQSFLAGDFAKAQKAVDRSIALNPNVPKVHVLNGRIALETGDLEKAITAFQLAEAIDPQFVDALYYQGIVNERLERLDVAISFYQRAAEVDSANAQYALAAAEVMIQKGDLTGAEAYVKERQGMFPHNAGLIQTLGNIAMLQGNADAAVEQFSRARLLSPEDSSISIDLAQAQVAASRFAEAELVLARLLNDPALTERRDLRMLRARCLIQIDRLLDAREILIGLTKGQEGTNDPDSWLELGNVSYKLKDDRRTREAASRVIALAPTRSEGYALRALVSRRGNQFTQARRDIQRAIEITPSADFYVLQGMIEQDLGLHEAATASYRTALQINPESTEAATRLNAAQSRFTSASDSE